MNTQASDSYLRTLISWGEQNAAQYLDEFLDGFPTMRPGVADGLRRWATPMGGPESSEMAQRIYSESFKWRSRLEQLDQRIKEIQAVLPELEQIAGGPAATDADKAALRTAKAALKLANAQIAQLRGDYWIGVLEEYGLFPNYTLIDDAVDLDVALSWIDPDTGEYQDESFTFSRGAALALRDFAPGATFYARGRQVKVDAVDLGHDATAIREIEYCPGCGYVRGLGPAGVPCPRCGSKGIADVQQRIKTVELVRVSSAMRREESVIDDSRDDRIREPFNVVVSADVDPNKITRQWFVKDQGFGVRHLRDMHIQWTNLGRGQTQGPKMMVASEETVANLFRVCVHCGQVDNHTQANQASEHRPWCPQRRKHEEDTRSIALSRTLVTEGLVVRLPPLISMGDQFAVPSLSAALQLGLREMIGGAPDHIEVEVIVDPSATEGTPNYDALLLHDVVPGGTGYLADLAQPEEFWRVLCAAWQVLRSCECANENRLACHRCLLPFAGNRVKYVSRLTAERHLRAILAGSDDGEVPEALGWELTDVAVQQFDPETQIEKKFRSVLRGRLEAAGMKVEEKPGPNGNRWRIRAGGERVWTLEPQQNLGPAKPDFVLSCNQPLPQMAIFCDGWRFHASPEINRLADDAVKREDLRAAGHIVVGLTWRDLEEAGASKPPQPPWFNSGAANQLKQVPGSGVTERDLTVMAGGPIDMIIDWIQRPVPDTKEKVANLTPMVFAPMAKLMQISETEALPGAAMKLMAGEELASGEARAWFWRLDTLGVLARHSGGPAIDDIEVALLIDDRSASLGPEHKDAWNAWLSLSNALALRVRPTTITTVSLAGAAQPRSEVVAVDLPEGWAEIHADATELERVLLVALAERDLALPQVGLETDGGIPLAFAWPDFHVAVGFDLSTDERAELESEGWQVVEAEAGAIAEALTGRSE